MGNVLEWPGMVPVSMNDESAHVVSLCRAPFPHWVRGISKAMNHVGHGC